MRAAARLSAAASFRSGTQDQIPQILSLQQLAPRSSQAWGPLANLQPPAPLAAESDLCEICVCALSALCAPQADPIALWATRARSFWILVPEPFLT